MPRRPDTWVSVCNLILKLEAFRTAPLSSGRIVPRVTIAGVTTFITLERHYVKRSIAGYLRLQQPTPVPALMRELHWLHCLAEEPGTPLAIRPKIMARYDTHSMQCFLQ